jgi:predicted small lipoprotein YifL
MRHTILILTLVFLTGCGSKGALYLPEGEEQAAPPPPPSLDEGVELDTGEEDLEPGAGDKDDAL